MDIVDIMPLLHPLASRPLFPCIQLGVVTDKAAVNIHAQVVILYVCLVMPDPHCLNCLSCSMRLGFSGTVMV